MKKYELIIVWDTGDTEKHLYNEYTKAYEILTGYKMAFGNQINYIDIRRCE